MNARLLMATCLAICGAGAQAQGFTKCAQIDNQVSCTIEVVVSEVNLFGEKKCFVTLRNPLRHFWIGFKRPGGSVVLTWRINTDESDPGYKFTAAGVAFSGNPATFTNKVPGNTDFSWTNLREGPVMDYKYTVAVENGPVSCDLDPWVRNQ